MSTKFNKLVSRRKILKSIAATAGGAATFTLAGGFPTVWAQNIKDVTLGQIGGSYSNMPEIAAQASKDLGFTIEMQALDPNSQAQRTITQPKSFAINDINISELSLFIGKGLLQPLDSSRYKYRDETVSIWATGKNKDGSAVSRQGVSPADSLFYSGKDGSSFSSEPTQWWTGVPSVYNADTLGIRPDLIGRNVDSWADLLNPEFAGKVALVNHASTGIMDVAMAIEASGQIAYGDKGDMTREEIDKTIAIMRELKASGHFRAFWGTFDQSVNLMASGEVVIQSMWSPAVTAVRSRGIPCVYPKLKEGHRGWGSVLAPQAHLSGLELDAFYEYANWYNSGWVGSFMARQGYYTSVLSTAKAAMKSEEWGFWYEGKPATGNIVDPFGNTIGKSGDVRDGGSYWDRMGSIAAWNTRMSEDRYLTRRWNEFISG